MKRQPLLTKQARPKYFKQMVSNERPRPRSTTLNPSEFGYIAKSNTNCDQEIGHLEITKRDEAATFSPTEGSQCSGSPTTEILARQQTETHTMFENDNSGYSSSHGSTNLGHIIEIERERNIYSSRIFILSVTFAFLGLICFSFSMTMYLLSPPILKFNLTEPGILSAPQLQPYLLPSDYENVHGDRIQSCANLQNPSPPNDDPHTCSITFNWTKPMMNFCSDPEINILVATNIDPKGLPNISCPEKVMSLEIVSVLNVESFKWLLKTFCGVRKISFIGQDVCADQIEVIPNNFEKLITDSLEVVKFQDLDHCSNLFRFLSSTTKIPFLRQLSFQCVTFENKNFSELDTFVLQSTNFTTIRCHEKASENCKGTCTNLKFNFTPVLKLVTEVDVSNESK